MRFLLILIVVAFAGCDGSSETSTETAADDLQESIDTSMQKAEDVEKVLQKAKDDADAAIEEASGGN